MPEVVYSLPHVKTEAQRLNKQGLVYESALGYQIHPDIVKTLPGSPRIADIGTGSGDYLVRLSQAYSQDSRFDGFDISSGCFCAESERPENVKLHVHDVRIPFPAEYHGQFDFIHLRLLVLGLRKDDWSVVTRNLVQLLRPGGAIQWEECDILGQRCIRGEPGTTCKYLEAILTPVLDDIKAKFLSNPISVLPEILRGAGLQAVVQDFVSSDRILEDRKNIGATTIEGARAYLMATGKSVNPEIGTSMDEAVRKAYEDLENGAYWRHDIYATIGFKPK